MSEIRVAPTTAAPTTAAGRRGSWLPTASLWLAFVVVHAGLSTAALVGAHTPLNDVTTVYHDWMLEGVRGEGWVGIDRVWVYPTLALVPMLASAALGFAAYTQTWLVLVAILDAVAFAVLTRFGTRRRSLGAWWLVFLLLLGPIAVGRIDTITVPVALVGLLWVSRRPLVAGILLGIATWIKVWPVALVVAAVVASKRRMPVVGGFAALGLLVVVGVLALGGTATGLLGFVTQQTGRGLQIEAPVATWWLWLEALRVPGAATVWNPELLTFQIRGPGAEAASTAMTPVMAVVMAGLLLLGVRAVRRGAAPDALLAPLALALTTAFIVTNKVGSPQYETWLAVPVLVGLVAARRGSPSFTPFAGVTLAIAVLTQVVYPWGYDPLLLAEPWIVGVITVRNTLLVVLLVLAARRVWRVGRAGAGFVAPAVPASEADANRPPGARMDA
ncbi:hypothetical protein AS850_09205 [Frondihabitans sp. 762G35]|uniref:glycosyltransferase 87 family protein n=1 Tax=Frondihabitans sp. 762G35 TaxID=1446794 RepID=UPI000D226CB4|nr:glycosyltransferase 87 family protein [Frondihabitans sp. 762G35]ARC57252.1 hypothetical protein AS850_09205 [Frondihabitans sp. 762G35]